jgi:deoxyadenosine/deoxycytidine kinase
MSKVGKRKTCFIEGPIAAGKTTFCNKFNAYLKDERGIASVLCEEPVKLWIEDGTLEKSYENPKVWSFPAQCHFFDTRVDAFCDTYTNSTDADWIISERSLLSDKMFWDTKLKMEDIEVDLHSIYLNMWKKWQRLLPIERPELVVYLKTPVETCMSRLHERGRKEETTVTASYQRHLIECHDTLLTGGTQGVQMPDGTFVRCVVIDATLNFRDDEEIFKRIAEEIVREMESASVK